MFYRNQSHLGSRLRGCNGIDCQCIGQSFFLYLIILECFLCSNGTSIYNSYLEMNMIDIVWGIVLLNTASFLVAALLVVIFKERLKNIGL